MFIYTNVNFMLNSANLEVNESMENLLHNVGNLVIN
jgi:hypothetical protein